MDEEALKVLLDHYGCRGIYNIDKFTHMFQSEMSVVFDEGEYWYLFKDFPVEEELKYLWDMATSRKLYFMNAKI